MKSTKPNNDEAVSRLFSGQLWSKFCDDLKAAGDDVLRLDTEDPLDAVEGYRLLTRLLRGALEERLEWANARHPTLICTCHETIKLVAENPDNIYLGCKLRGDCDYRIYGTRGEAKWISFNTFPGGGFGGGGRGTGTTLHEEQLEIGPDGRFEVILSQREHPGNWLRLEPDTASLTVRQTFWRKGRQRPAELRIERINTEPEAPPVLTADVLEHVLAGCVHHARMLTQIGAGWAQRNASKPNVFWDAQEEDTKKFMDPQIQWQMAYLKLQPDEALIVEFVPPKCDYWMIALHNHWMETLDYRYHQIALNTATATAAADGTVRCVVAHRDPGMPNWLDLAGHVNTVLGVRWVGANIEGTVVPATRLVKLEQLGT
jgi:hypothetical protein